MLSSRELFQATGWLINVYDHQIYPILSPIGDWWIWEHSLGRRGVVGLEGEAMKGECRDLDNKSAENNSVVNDLTYYEHFFAEVPST